MNPPPVSITVVASAPWATTVSSVNSPGWSSNPPQTTVPEFISDQSPDLLALMTRCTSEPSLGPRDLGFTVRPWDTSTCCAAESAGSSRATSRTFTSSAIKSVKSASDSASAATTVSWDNGSLTLSPAALRSAAVAEHTSRTRSIAATRPGSDGRQDTSGQSLRWTERLPVRPRQISSLTSDRSGATTRQVISSAVYSVSNASRETAASAPEVPQNRARERRMYQFVSTSTKDRASSQALATSKWSSCHWTVSVNWRSLARR